MNSALANAVIIGALVLAAAGGLSTLLDRPAGRVLQLGAVIVQALVLALTVTTIAAVIGGDRPEEAATFAGYGLTAFALMPTAVVLARMEPTRWGSAIIGGAALILPVLVLRLQQVHG
ncbi:hypothetical protein [Pilimelia columellifera]|uniref:hypothetical protein n=1 Tax=Pilimelia columellifera TaxID=706574 RepID=UPI0031CFC07E